MRKWIHEWGRLAAAFLAIFALIGLFLNLLPNDEGDKAWIKQQDKAFNQGDLFVASKGCFRDHIEIAWVDPTESTAWKDAYQFEIIWGLTPPPYYHRDGVAQTEIRNLNIHTFSLTPEVWANDKNHRDSPGRKAHPELKKDQMVFFQMGYYWGNTNQPQHRLFDGKNWPTVKYVAGWMGQPSRLNLDRPSAGE